MAKNVPIIALKADPSDPDDFDVTEEELQAALAERRRRGPQKAATKEQVTIRLDHDVIEHFRAAGPGWQSRVNAALRSVAGLRNR
ncbi:BrnA antitoxin of type II toxin-antitoxin system [Sphingomonas sp. YR710]|jgi:uncharacterized protein (DUF4415 family)|uniref:BrnA antitoxin family protein n=1 Tax=Sphingomonas sp. YR710 TaxID=1882773 RepID=UPI000890C0A7|nr:BrnA antitoxin family protein [Sphingomonas sp. YR710]SDC84418.1 BrnA antitoxin of type II toxin-antitoxin system [Sphingomonas sp. YR710]